MNFYTLTSICCVTTNSIMKPTSGSQNLTICSNIAMIRLLRDRDEASQARPTPKVTR